MWRKLILLGQVISVTLATARPWPDCITLPPRRRLCLSCERHRRDAANKGLAWALHGPSQQMSLCSSQNLQNMQGLLSG
jgi:hypothetical protein